MYVKSYLSYFMF